MSPDWTFKSLICEMGIIAHRVLDIMQVKCLAQRLAQRTSSMAAPQKTQTLLCCFCHYVWDPRGLAPPTSGGLGASDEHMLDLNTNPTRMCRLHSLLLHMEKVCSGDTEILPKASAFQTTSPGSFTLSQEPDWHSLSHYWNPQLLSNWVPSNPTTCAAQGLQMSECGEKIKGMAQAQERRK